MKKITTNTYGLTVGDLKAREILANIAEKMRKDLQEGDTDGDEDIPFNFPMPSRIHSSGPVTVVVWEDGSKTVVRKAKDIPDDPYSAFCAALAKKIYGNNTRVKKILRDKTYVPKKKAKDGNPTMREEK